MLSSLQRAARGANVVVAAAAVVVVGMAYTLLWGTVVHHASNWVVPGDIWGTFRDAHIVGWGGEGILYSSGIVRMTGFVSMPAMPVLLAPVAMLSGALHLTESLPFTLARPTAWLLLGPVEMAVGAGVLFPLDALARRLGVRPPIRVVAVWVEAALVLPVVAWWGHPEDLAALGLGVYALMAGMDGRWRRAALLLGLALAFQPLVVVLVPLLLAVLPWRRWIGAASLIVAPSALLLLAPLAHAWRTTVQTIVDQPTFPSVDHPTPWVAFAPVLQGWRLVHGASLHLSHGRLVVGAATAHSGPVVAGGPPRLIPLAASLVLAVIVARRRLSERAIWCVAALALALRCAFEPVMTPYYAVPALALALVLAAGSGRRRLIAASLAAAACSYLGYRHAGTWAYYVPVTITLLATVAAAAPRRIAGSVEPAGGSVPTAAGAVPDLEPALT